MALAPIVLDSGPGLDDTVALQCLLGTGPRDFSAHYTGTLLCRPSL